VEIKKIKNAVNALIFVCLIGEYKKMVSFQLFFFFLNSPFI